MLSMDGGLMENTVKIECAVPDAPHTVRDRIGCPCVPAGILNQPCFSFVKQNTVVVAAVCGISLAHRNTRQTVATYECVVSDERHTVRDHNARQTVASYECAVTFTACENDYESYPPQFADMVFQTQDGIVTDTVTAGSTFLSLV